MYDDTMITIMS